MNEADEKKPKLKVTTKIVNIIDYHDLNSFILEVTGLPYEIVAYEELSNYSVKSFTVEPALNDWERKEIEAWISTKRIRKYRTSAILNYLCMNGHLDPGEYTVEVSW